jgi:hypothetical protein
VDEDCRLFGVQRESAATDDGEDFEVWEQNWEILNWFLKMERRWIFDPMYGKRVRLDDQAVAAQLKIYGVKKAKRKIIMDDLLAMETAALEVLNRD